MGSSRALFLWKVFSAGTSISLSSARTGRTLLFTVTHCKPGPKFDGTIGSPSCLPGRWQGHRLRGHQSNVRSWSQLEHLPVTSRQHRPRSGRTNAFQTASACLSIYAQLDAIGERLRISRSSRHGTSSSTPCTLTSPFP